MAQWRGEAKGIKSLKILWYLTDTVKKPVSLATIHTVTSILSSVKGPQQYPMRCLLQFTIPIPSNAENAVLCASARWI